MKRVTQKNNHLAWSNPVWVPAKFSQTAFTAKEGIAALERLKDGPFTLTISIGPPHPPTVVSEPYYSLYAPDPRENQQMCLPCGGHRSI